MGSQPFLEMCYSCKCMPFMSYVYYTTNLYDPIPKELNNANGGPYNPQKDLSVIKREVPVKFA